MAQCEKSDVENANFIADTTPSTIQDDVADASLHSATIGEGRQRDQTNCAGDVPAKKRKTRRGKTKRKYLHPYRKSDAKSNKIPEAPYNSNRFLIEDHGDLEAIDEEIKKSDQVSTSTIARTRDSSLSMDSDVEFYSTPEDEEQYLIKDFDVQYQSLQAERLHAMSKDELIQEFIALESKVEMLTKRLRSKSGFSPHTDHKQGESNLEVQKEVQRLTIENEALRRENEILKNESQSSSDSADSETDSSDTCSSSSSSSDCSDVQELIDKKRENSSRSETPVDYAYTNGHSEEPIQST